MLVAIAERGNDVQRRRAIAALRVTERFRGRRESLRLLAAPLPVGQKRRTVFDAGHGMRLPGKLVRSEGEGASKDVAVNEAYDGAGSTYDFYGAAYDRNSIDNKGMRLDSSVHYSTEYDNAFWNGQEMVYGDGDGDLFQRFTISVDVIGHELTHGVTAAEANLDYENEPGALNESFSDVFGSLVKQWSKNQAADQADWLIGEGLFTPKVKGMALRSMKSPGTAYDDPVLGKDPQPADMSGFYTGTDDDGGVHINSGIPNRAFYLAATAIGGFAWEKAGLIWYTALRDRLRHDASFATAAAALVGVARELFGENGGEQRAVSDAWTVVGVLS
jgi:Zn-dependent metalloprotease